VSDSQATSAPADPRPKVERLLHDILGLMGFPARLEFQDASDGSLSVAVHFQGELPPGVEPGRRSQVVDSLQFLLNKMLHRPGAERRFILVGAGFHPEPRGERLKREQAVAAQAPVAQAPAPAAQAPAPAPAAKKGRAEAQAAPAAKAPRAGGKAAAAARPVEGDERALEVSEDAELARAARLLAEKSASLGRFYALAAMNPDDRARVSRAVEGVAGVKVACEGEGRNRRVVFAPDKPAPLPKRSLLPQDDDEDDLEG
jgi:predicted RNA-binding protein Jag